MMIPILIRKIKKRSDFISIFRKTVYPFQICQFVEAWEVKLFLFCFWTDSDVLGGFVT